MMTQSPRNKINFQEKKKKNKDKNVEINRLKTEKREKTHIPHTKKPKNKQTEKQTNK